MADEPDYVICLDCDTPLYVFEWRDKLREAICPVCGNEDTSSFATQEDLEELALSIGDGPGG